MGKKITTLSIDEEVIAQGKRQFVNLSRAAEEGIKARLGIKEVQIVKPEVLKCEFCGIEGKQLTRDNPEGTILWVLPFEQWLCESCLSLEVKKVKASKH